MQHASKHIDQIIGGSYTPLISPLDTFQGNWKPTNQ